MTLERYCRDKGSYIHSIVIPMCSKCLNVGNFVFHTQAIIVDFIRFSE